MDASFKASSGMVLHILKFHVVFKPILLQVASNLKEGEIIDRFIIVEAGTLIRTKSTEADGAPLPLDELGAGKVTGFLHVLGHHNDDKVSVY